MAAKKKLKYDADPAAVQRAIDAIGQGFSWHATPQGPDYWEKVLQNLEGMLDEVKPLRKTRS